MVLKEHASAVMYKTHYGIPVVRDHSQKPALWKLPGGRSQKDETPKQTALREFQEETGLKLKIDELNLIYEENRRNHNFYIFLAASTEAEKPKLKKRGNEGEEVAILLPDEILKMDNFLHGHLAVIKNHIQGR